MITISNLHLKYMSDRGIVHAVRGVSLTVEKGQFYTLLGPSGCGKTTTLRSIAGLENPSDGEITIDGEVVFSSERRVLVPTHKRDIGMVFQSYAIWPHMTVFENVAFPLRERRNRYNRSQIRDRVERALALVQLSGLEDRPAPFLSGGQQQRLALARCIVYEPKVLLLDEPLSNLDAKLREDTRVELRDLVKRLGMTTVYVTHDQLEALTMSDLVAVMKDGEIVQEATPTEIYCNPRERFIANFIGSINFLAGRISDTTSNHVQGLVDTNHGQFLCVFPPDPQAGMEVVIGIRPEDISVIHADDETFENVLSGTVTSTMFMGDALEVRVAAGADNLRLKLHPSESIAEGDIVRLGLPARACRVLVA